MSKVINKKLMNKVTNKKMMNKMLNKKGKKTHHLFGQFRES
jgi:hypothetical protein